MAHLNSHDEQFLSKFCCDICNYKGFDNWNLKRHKKRKHPTSNSGVNDEQLVIANRACDSNIDADNEEVNKSNENQITDLTLSKNSYDEIVIDEMMCENDELAINSDEVGEVAIADKIPEPNNEILHSNPKAKTRDLSRYEQIRLDIISEREKLMADSGIMEEIWAAKQDVAPKKRVKRKLSEIQNLPMRRSARKCLSDNVFPVTNSTKPPDNSNIENMEIKLEISW